MRSHGTGAACYHEKHPVKCDDCKAARRERGRELRANDPAYREREAERRRERRANDPLYRVEESIKRVARKHIARRAQMKEELRDRYA